MTAQTSAPSENWDDDFEFNSPTNNPKPRKPEPTTSLPPEARASVASPRFSEDWDADDGPKAPVAGSSRALGGTGSISNRLDNWAESGPSAPIRHAGTEENWDDDFEDKADSSPARRSHAHRASHHALQHHHPTHPLRTRHSYHTPPRPKPPAEPENWDDDFDDPMDPTNSTSPTKTDQDSTPVTKRTRREAYADTSDEDEDVDFGFSEDKEEDKTLTAQSRTAPLHPGSSNSHIHANPSHSSSPPVPVLSRACCPSPIEPFPRSPTVSVFSIPTTSGRNSIGHFNSTSHLVLSGAVSSLALLPSSPPTQRERRRLRKKSRPPHIDNNVFELIEEPYDMTPPPLPPSTPERESASSPPMIPMMPSSSIEATPTGSKAPLLSRIGSVKKWGVRRKRASTGPEVMMQDFGTSIVGIMEQENTPRPPSSLEQTQPQTPAHRNRHNGPRSAWFFRPGGAHYGAGSPPPVNAELEHEKSLDQRQLRPGAGVKGGEASGQVPTTPNKNRRLSRRKASEMLIDRTSSSELTGDGSSTASGVMGVGKPSLGPGRRPTSMQMPNGALLAVGNGSNKFSSLGARHASYGSSVGRVSSSRVFSTPTPTESTEDFSPTSALLVQEGCRSFMGNIRKISIVSGKKHKKDKLSVDATGIQSPTCRQDQDGMGDAYHPELVGDARMQTQTQSRPDLLPPIELHPPSPPRAIRAAQPIAPNITDKTEPMMPSTSAPASINTTPVASSTSPVVSSKTALKTPSSPQSASLGRTAQAPSHSPSNAPVPRRNSLGDLKIPARISQAQIGLKRDLGMVREFATSVDRLKELQTTYRHLLSEVQTVLENASPSRATSPNMFSLVRPRSRLRSNTSPPTNPTGAPSSFSEYKHIVATLHAITVKYKVSWECAELLIELGGRAPSPAAGPSSSSSAPSVSLQAEFERRKNRERAITLSGEDSKPTGVALVSNTTASSSTSGPPNASWRASTGRHDLSQRQLVLLRDMLNNCDPPHDDMPSVEENVNRNWRWGDAMGSTVTLPSEDSSSHSVDNGEGVKKKRRSGRMGLIGLRDMLRMLKWSHSEPITTPSVPDLSIGPSTVSLSTDSSHCSHHRPHGRLGADGAQQAMKTSAGPESVRSTKDMPASSPYSAPLLSHKSSPRRPSLASIFRIGQKSRSGTSSSAGESSQDSRSDVRSASRGSNMTVEEEDWDRIESAIDLDTAVRTLGSDGTATIKCRRGRMSPFVSDNHGHTPASPHQPATPRRVQESTTQAMRMEVEASPRSLRPMRSTRLSNVEEVEDGERQVQKDSKAKNRVSLPRTSPHRPPSKGTTLPVGSRTGSVRSAPPQPVEDPHTLPGIIKLSMTPENIRPLLENAKEVHVRCHECIRELHTLLDAMSVGSSASAN